MTEVAKKNDLLSSFFGGIGGKGSSFPIILVIILLLFFSGGTGIGKGKGSFLGGLDDNLILIFVLFIILFGGSSSFKF